MINNERIFLLFYSVTTVGNMDISYIRMSILPIVVTGKKGHFTYKVTQKCSIPNERACQFCLGYLCVEELQHGDAAKI